MMSNHLVPLNLSDVRGTEFSATDTREQYRQKIARITLDSMVQFVGLLDAEGTVLEINQVALDAVGITLADVEGKPFWTTFWWQVSEEVNATLQATQSLHFEINRDLQETTSRIALLEQRSGVRDRAGLSAGQLYRNRPFRLRFSSRGAARMVQQCA